jgi:hypothetical protein
MRKLSASTIAVAVIAGVAVFGQTTAADARRGGDHRNCVTYGEFRQIDRAMSKRAVYRLLDGRGKRVTRSTVSGLISEMREWESCPGKAASSVIVHFDDYSFGSYSRGGPMEVSYKDHSVFW